MRNYKRFALWRLPETGRTLTTIISYWKRLQVISRQNGILKSVHSVAWKTDNPVMNLLRTFRENDRKISELTSLLKEMERNDVLEELQPYIGQWNAAYKLGRIVCLTWGLPVNTDTKRSCHSVRIIRMSVLSRLSEKMSQTTVLSIWRLKQTFSQRL